MPNPRVQVRRELVFLALATMEACVVAPILTALLTLVGPADPLIVMGVFLGAVLATHYVARGVVQLPLHDVFRSGLLVVGMLVSALVVVHRLLHATMSFWDLNWLCSALGSLEQDGLSLDLVFFLVVAFLWWRGFVLARRRLESGTVVTRFRSGVILLAITTVIGGFVLPAPPYQFVFVYFFVSLMGIALARAEEVGTQYGGGQAPFSAGWLVMVLVATLGVLLLSAGVATVLTGENVSRFVEPMMTIQRFLFNLLVYAFLIAFSWLGRLVIELMEKVFTGLDTQGIEGLLNPLDLDGGPGPGEAGILTPGQMAIARGAGVFCGLLILLLVLAWWLRRFRVQPARRRGDERESVWEEVDLRRSLRDLWDEGRRRLGEAAAVLGHSLLGQFFVALTIRRIYAHLSALAAELGHPRAVQQTPYEYQPVLEEAFAEYPEAIARITRSYVAVHYGEIPEQPEELAVIRAAWKQLREAAEAAAK
jgi:hypothetical protein